MRSLALLVVAAVLGASAATPQVPAPQGFVTDTTGTVGAEAKQKMTRLIEELQQKTGSEIAVLVVDSTAPLDDFNYAMQVADTWKPGRKRDDTGVIVLLALKDRKLRILTGYGIEGTLPDGLVGEIEDREMIPALRQGKVDESLWRGVAEIASRIAAAKGVALTGLPERRAAPQPTQTPLWAVLLVIAGLILFQRLFGRRGGFFLPGRRGGGFHGGFGGGGGGFGGSGGSGGGFGGFGGGGFGGGGAGRSW